MHLAIRASIGLLLLCSAVTKADVFDPYYDPLVAEASQQQSSFSSISTSNTVGQGGSRPHFQSVASFSSNNNGQNFGGTIVNNNGQVSHHSHPGTAQKDYWWMSMGNDSPFKRAEIDAGNRVVHSSGPCNTNAGCSASSSSINIINPISNSNNNPSISNKPLDLSNNPYINGNYLANKPQSHHYQQQQQQQQQHPVQVTQHGSTGQNYAQNDYSHNPFISGGTHHQKQSHVVSNSVISNGNKGAEYAGHNSVNSFVSGSHNAHKTQYNPGKGSQFISVSQSSNKTPCSEQGKICAPKSFCKNGLVRSDQLSLLDDSRSECESGEVCCKIYYNSQAGSPFQSAQQVRCRSGNQKCVPQYLCVNGELSSEGLRYAARLLPAQTCSNGDVCCSEARAFADSVPAAANSNPLTANGYVIKVPDRRYLPSEPERPDEEPAQSGDNVQNVPTQPPPVVSTTYLPATSRPVVPQRPSQRPSPPRPVTPRPTPPRQRDEIPQPDTNNPAFLKIPVGCPAAMNCTTRDYCDATGTMSKTPVDLSPEQSLFRVPMIECRDRQTGSDGVCCRDPDYTDPWPTEILGQYRPDLLGFDDGSYKPEASNRRSVVIKAAASQVRPLKVRPGTPLRASPSNTVQRQVASPNSIFPSQPTPAACGKRDRNSEPRGQTETEANFGEFPWQVMVARESTKTLLCGGVVLGPNHVLATAKCLQGVRPSDVVTKVGEWQLGSTAEPRPFQIMHVRSIQPHPQFNPNTLEYDIAIIHLSEPIRFDQHVAPICIDENELSNSLDNCVTTGWGKEVLRIHARDAIMHYTDVFMMPEETCSSYLQSYGFNPQSSLCGHTRIDACQVDPGSALACQRPSGDYVLKGVYSTETDCNTESQLVTFTKVDAKWIKSAMNGGGRSVPQFQAQANEPREYRVRPNSGYLPPRN